MQRNLKETVLDRLNKREFYESYGLKLITSGSQLKALCPFHDDTAPSLSIDPESGLFNCFSCHAKGSPIDFVMLKEGVDFRSALGTLAKRVGQEIEHIGKAEEDPPPISEDKIDQWHKRLLSAEDRLKFIVERRGLKEDTIARFRLGWDGDRYTIPVPDNQGIIRNVRKYKPFADGKDKMISHTERGKSGGKVSYGKARLFPAVLPESGPVIIAEGEMDCMLAIQEGLPAITVTSGAGTWNPEWSSLFDGRDVILAFDNDKAGRIGSERVAAFLIDHAKSVRILSWPKSMQEKGDITDWFVSLGETVEGFHNLLAKARPYVPPAKEPEREVTDIELASASKGELHGKPIRMRVMVSGKDTAPYMVPGRIEATCDQDNGNKCFGCGMHLIHHGKADIEFWCDNRETLGLLRCSDEQQRGFIRKRLGIFTACSHWKVRVRQSQSVEEIQVIPEVNGKLQQDAEGEYVTRTMYAMKHGVKTNSVYEVQGYPFPDVRDQHATCLLGSLKEVEVSIDKFELTDQDIEDMRIFNPGPEETVDEKMYGIARELEKVHRIRNRLDLTIALDLGWHSVLSFNCFGELQRKGWVEIFVVGSSGQGKTTAAIALADYYRAGQRVQAEQSSSAGLVGGLSKHADRWHITWGPIVLNDRRLLIIDEWSGVRDEDAERLTDIRSTGIAEIVKIHRERAWARTRLIFLSNPKDGRQLDQLEHGCEALKSLFTKAEDIRRIDLAITVASGQVSIDVLNRIYEQEPCRYSSDVCSKLVMWAWSRKSNQIVFDHDAQETILSLSKYLSGKYSSALPLVEPADMRWKIARMAASCAARLFSTDDGVTLRVRKEHAEFVVGFIDKVYSDYSMGYDRYSRRMRVAERYVDDHKEEIVQTLLKLHPNPKELIEFLITEKYLAVRELDNQLSLDKDQVKVLMRFLQSKRLIERTSHGYRKRPKFIELLRELEDGPADLLTPVDPMGFAESDKPKSMFSDD